MQTGRNSRDVIILAVVDVLNGQKRHHPYDSGNAECHELCCTPVDSVKGARGAKRRKSVEGAKAELAPIQQPEQGSAIEEAEEVCHTSFRAATSSFFLCFPLLLHALGVPCIHSIVVNLTKCSASAPHSIPALEVAKVLAPSPTPISQV